MYVDSIFFQLLLQYMSGISIFPGQELARPLNHMNLCAKPLEALTKLTSDGPTAQDEQGFRLPCQVKYSLCCVVRDILQPRDTGDVRPATGGNSALEECQCLAIDAHLILAYKLSLT